MKRQRPWSGFVRAVSELLRGVWLVCLAGAIKETQSVLVVRQNAKKLGMRHPQQLFLHIGTARREKLQNSVAGHKFWRKLTIPQHRSRMFAHWSRMFAETILKENRYKQSKTRSRAGRAQVAHGRVRPNFEKTAGTRAPFADVRGGVADVRVVAAARALLAHGRARSLTEAFGLVPFKLL